MSIDTNRIMKSYFLIIFPEVIHRENSREHHENDNKNDESARTQVFSSKRFD